MTRLLPDGPIDTLGVRAVIAGTAHRIGDAFARGTSVGPRSDRGVVVVATGSLRIAARAAVAVAGDLAAPVVVADAVPGYAADGWAVVDLSGLIDAPISARFDMAAAVAAVLGACNATGALRTPMSIEAASAQVERRLTGRAEGDPGAVARHIGRLMPLVHGAGSLGAAAAAHWKQQVNLNAKAPAFATGLVDPVDGELSGWGQHGDVTRQVFTLVMLRHDHEPESVRVRIPAIEDLVGEVVHDRIEVVAEGDGPVAQLLDLIVFGDLMSVELATLNEIDPGPTGVESLLPAD